MAKVWLCALALATVGTAARAANLDVTVTGIRSDRGKIGICVFSQPGNFPDCAGDAAALSRWMAASAGQIQVAVAVDPGVHAVSVYHDENNNGRMDRNLLGIPREGGGVSNNPPLCWGPPRFDDARFAVPADGASVTIAMVYP